MYREKFIALVKAANKNADVLTVIEDQMNNLGSYVSTVYAMEVQMQTLRFRLDGEEYRDAITTLDSRRRSAHEAAIAGCSVLNRVAGMLGAAPLYAGSLEDRHEVADFCISIVDELFHGRENCSVQELISA